MAEGDAKPSGGMDPWLLIFLVLAVAAISSRGDGSLLGSSTDGVKFGSPSRSGTVEEEISSANNAPIFFTPQNPPPPTPPPSAPPSTISTISRPTRDNLSLQIFGSPKLAYSEEYIQISAKSSNQARVNITGMVLKNIHNESVIIGSDEFGRAILLNPGERAIISTMPSPRGFNFKVNKCSGYLSQTKNYSPSLDFFCPHISTLSQVRTFSEKCENYIKSINYCATPTINFQTGIENECAAFIIQHASYPGCVADFKNDADFDKKEWRIYLGLPREFWDNRHETIRVLDASGELLFEISY